MAGEIATRPAARTQLLEVHATMSVDLAQGADAQALTRSIVEAVQTRGGFVQTLEAGSGASAPTHLILRTPPSSLADLRLSLRGYGTIAQESTTATDVTDAIADVEARVKTAHAEEGRLLKLLDEKTGSLADVLAAERALADVRERIERLEAEARVARGRVDLATVDVTIRPFFAPVVSTPSLGYRAHEALKDGVEAARDVAVGTLMIVLRVGPTMMLLAPLGWLLLRALKRRRALAKPLPQ
jgi:hypothetical protein